MVAPTPSSGCAFVAGPISVWANIGAASALTQLGWTLNGINIEAIGFISPIHSDENGGEQGPPIDFQLMGQQHRITLELSKPVMTAMALLEPFYNPNTSSANIGVGMLLGCSTAWFRLLLMSPGGGTAFVRNYPYCTILEPIDYSPIGSQATRARVTFTANTIGGVLYNNTNS